MSYHLFMLCKLFDEAVTSDSNNFDAFGNRLCILSQVMLKHLCSHHLWMMLMAFLQTVLLCVPYSVQTAMSWMLTDAKRAGVNQRVSTCQLLFS